jgi:putative salt-induced outer membrane protein YdiY
MPPRTALAFTALAAGALPTTDARARTDLYAPASFTYAVAPEPPPEAPEQDPPSDLPPPGPSFFRGWTGSIEAGLNGSTGNSETLNLRGALSLNRDSTRMKTTFASYYAYGTSDGRKNRSRGELALRNDWKIVTSPWRVFATAKAEYDEFQDWTWRLSGIVGVGYAIIADERTNLIARLGLGGSREIGGRENDLVPELNLGADFDHRLTERQKIFAGMDFYPSLKDTADYRVVGRAGWEVLVDPEVNMTLKVGVENRYDSTPGPGRRKNDVDYYMLLGWKF